MFLWIRDQSWLPAISLASVCLLLFGGSDLLIQGPATLPATLVLSGAVAFSISKPYVAIALTAIGTFIPTVFELQPQISHLSTTVALLVLATFANTRQRWIGYSLNVVLGSAAYFWSLLAGPSKSIFYGIPTSDDKTRSALLVAGFIVMIAVNANAWFVGRLLYTRITHVGTSFDKALMTQQVVSSQLALAEQDRRFGIARDVNDLLLDQVSSTLSSAEAGVYAVKSDPTIAPRLIENLLDGVRKSYAEIRRLSDLLGLQKEKAIALPGIRDLDALYLAFREYGYRVTVRAQGDALNLVSGAELIIYRIIFESLGNVQKHSPLGTEIDVDLTWQEDSLQIVIKDNGEQTLREQSKDLSGYSSEDDQKALVERPLGAGLTTMAERASLYEGSMDFVRLPGVGFYVSASFPFISKYAQGS
jgi:signal transduction histidine kinase